MEPELKAEMDNAANYQAIVDAEWEIIHRLLRQSRFTPSHNIIEGVGARPTTAYGTVETVSYKRGAMSIYGSPSVSVSGRTGSPVFKVPHIMNPGAPHSLMIPAPS